MVAKLPELEPIKKPKHPLTFEGALSALDDPAVSSEEWVRTYGDIYKAGREAPVVAPSIEPVEPPAPTVQQWVKEGRLGAFSEWKRLRLEEAQLEPPVTEPPPITELPPALPPIAVPETPDELFSLMETVLPEMTVGFGFTREELIPQALENLETLAQERPEDLVELLLARGRTPESDAILSVLGATPEDIEAIFAEPEIPPEGLQFNVDVVERDVEVRKLAIFKPDLTIEIDGKVIGTYDTETGYITPREVTHISIAKENLGVAWGKYITGEFNWGEVGELALSGLGVAGTYLEKWVGRPWETAILEARSRFQLATGLTEGLERAADIPALKEWAKEKGIELSEEDIEKAISETQSPSELDEITLQRLQEVRNKYGWAGALVAEEVSDIWNGYVEQQSDVAGVALKVAPWLNPVYIVPVGGAFGLGARLTTKIPLLGKAMRFTASGVQAAERVAFAPVTKPLELGIKVGTKGLEAAGRGLGKVVGERLIRQTENLLLEVPESAKIVNAALQDNWMKKVLITAARVPPLKVGIEKSLGWRILIRKDALVVEDIVGRGGVLWAEINRMGINAKGVKIWELAEISRDPVKLFGFNKNAYSPKMARRLLPEFAAEKDISGTLEHVFTKPEMYSWEGLPKGLNYVTKVHEINTEVLNLLKAEGVAPKNLTEDWWVHRVVEGKFDAEGELIKLRGRPGVRGKRVIGAKPSYEMHRKAPTMAEGIAWGIQYSRNPEVAIASYIESAFKKMADERFVGYIAKEMEAAGKVLGVKPTEKLIRFPELFEEITSKSGRELAEKVVLRTEELSAAKQFKGIVTRMWAGERPHGATLAMLERKFPELGKRFRSALKKTGEARNAEMRAIETEVKELAEARKLPFWEAKTERAFRIEQLRQAGIKEGYIMQPFAGGKLYDREFIDAFNKFFGHEVGLPGLNVTSDIAGILRITKAALDFSVMAIQGLPSWGLAHAYLLQDPKVGMKLLGSWYKAFFESTAGFFRPDIIAGYVSKNKAVALQRASFGGSVRSIDFFATLEARRGIAGAAEKGFTKIPGTPYHRAETAFFGGGEIVRDEFWKILAPKAMARGQEFELARFLDRITGITDSAALGVPMTTRQLEQTFAWFAPNYTRACLTVLSDVFRGGFTGAEVRKALGGMLVAGSAMYSGVQYAIATTEGKSNEDAWSTVKEGFGIVTDPITGEANWQPTGRFMTIQIGNYYMGFGGFWYGLLRLTGNIMAAVNEVGDKERIDLVRIMKNGTLNKKDNPFIYWWYSRSSPLFGSGFELASGKDFLGYPLEDTGDYLSYIARRFEPIWAEQGLNWLIPGVAKDHEVPEGLARQALIPAELFGLRTFPESQWVKFYDKSKELIQQIPENEIDPKQLDAWRAGTLTWRQLTDIQKGNLISRYPELEEIYGEAQADGQVRSSQNWKQWQGRTEEEKLTYYNRGDSLIDRVRTGELDTRELREMWNEAGQNYGITLDNIAKEPAYDEIYKYFDKKEGKGEKYGFQDDIALQEYLNILSADFLDDKGDMDWDLRDKAVDDFIERWGEETYQRIRKYYADKKRLAGLDESLIRLADDKDKLGRTYWELPYKPINEMDEEDETEGNIPPQYLGLWKQYQALETDAQRDAFLEANPDLDKDWRAEYRLSNPEADARLALWGYGGKLQSREAYDKVVKWGQELGIPIEQMGLGLPPESLLDNYFELNEIVKETSGGSIDAKLYKLQHSNYLDWGVEQFGWSDLKDESIEALTLRVKWKGKEDTPKAKDDMRRVKMYNLNASPEIVEDFVEYGHTIDEFNSNSPEAKLFKIDHLTLFEFGQREDTFNWDDLRDENVKVLRLKVELNQLPEGATERKEIGKRIEAYGIEFPEKLIDTYVDWYLTERKGYEDDWFLIENQKFYKAMLDKGVFVERRDFRKVPSREVAGLLERYYKLSEGSYRGAPRFILRHENSGLEDYLVNILGYSELGDRWQDEPKEKLTPIEKLRERERKFKESLEEIEERLKRLTE